MFFRSMIGVVMIAGAMLVGTTAPAAADPPNCTAADLAGVMSGVNAGTSRDEMRTEIEAYGEANPQVRDELRAVRQPAADFRDRCNAPIPDGPMG